jgi:hypothetical protein
MIADVAVGEGAMVKLGRDLTSGLASAEVAKAYVAAVESSHQGVILDPRQFGKWSPPSFARARSAARTFLLSNAVTAKNMITK